MKKTCGGCKAQIDNYCILGYGLEIAKRWNGIAIAYKPTENCPKPKTNLELSYQQNIHNQRHTKIKGE